MKRIAVWCRYLAGGVMRGDEERQMRVFSYIGIEERIPKDHPIRAIRHLVDEILKRLTGEFDLMYSRRGRPSIAPEKLLRALVLQLIYSVRSERQLMERTEYDLLFRWFIGLEIDDPVWDASTFSKNRERLLDAEVSQKFLTEVVKLARRKELLSDEHFTVDGTLLEAWASVKSFRRKDGDPPGPASGSGWGEFKGEKRSNETHASTTDPDSRLYRKTKHTEPKLSYLGNVLMDNRRNLVVAAYVTKADGYGERRACAAMLRGIVRRGRPTVSGDKAYDTRELIATVQQLGFEPHIAQKEPKRTSVPKRLQRTRRYAMSQACRKHIEHIFGWCKAPGRLEKLRHRGREKVDWVFTFTAAIFNVVRMARMETGLA